MPRSCSPQRLPAGDPPDVWQTFPGGPCRRTRPGPGGRRQRGVHRRRSGRGPAEGASSTGSPSTASSTACRPARHRGNMLFFNKAVLAKAGVAPPAAGYTMHRVRRRPGEGDESGAAPVPRRQGPVHHRRAVREHPALHRRRRRVARIVADRFDWIRRQRARRSTQFGHRARPRRSASDGLTWDAGDQEARGRRVRVRDLERLRLRRAGRERRPPTRRSARCRSPAPTGSTSPWSTPSFRPGDAADGAQRARLPARRRRHRRPRWRSTRPRARCRCAPTSTSRR